MKLNLIFMAALTGIISLLPVPTLAARQDSSDRLISPRDKEELPFKKKLKQQKTAKDPDSIDLKLNTRLDRIENLGKAVRSNNSKQRQTLENKLDLDLHITSYSLLKKETARQERLTANNIEIRNFKIVGNTIYSTETLQNLLTQFIGQEISPGLIAEVSRIVTEYYVERGYTASFARVVADELSDGTLTVLVTESKIDRIEVEVSGYLSQGYVRDRIATRFRNDIFNIRTLEETILLLREDNNIEAIDIEVSADPEKTGAVILTANAVAAPIAALRARFSNRRSPLVGSDEIITQVETGVFGIGDKLSGLYSYTSGSDGFGINYNLPLSAAAGNLNFFYGQNANDLLEAPFDVLDANVDAEYFNVGYSLPLISHPLEKLSVGVTGSFAEATATNIIEGQPVRLLRGADLDGKLTVSALRFPLQYLVRDRNRNIVALQTELSIGIDAFDATINDFGAPDGRFVSWRSSAQYINRLAPDTFLFVRSGLQLAKDSLPALEQIDFGGIDTVRGYRSSLAVGDNGVFVSGELRYPLWRNEAEDMRLQLVPFLDFAKVWNTDSSIPAVTDLFSIGLGLRFELSDRLTVALNYGVPLLNRNNPNVNETIQDEGFSFSITSKIIEF